MSEFRPKNMPEITVYFEYSPAEKQTFDHPGYPEEFEFYRIEINENAISPYLEDHLIDAFAEDWEDELKELRFEEGYDD